MRVTPRSNYFDLRVGVEEGLLVDEADALHVADLMIPKGNPWLRLHEGYKQWYSAIRKTAILEV